MTGANVVVVRNLWVPYPQFSEGAGLGSTISMDIEATMLAQPDFGFDGHANPQDVVAVFALI